VAYCLADTGLALSRPFSPTSVYVCVAYIHIHVSMAHIHTYTYMCLWHTYIHTQYIHDLLTCVYMAY
jgi:hypothetical protein